MQQLDEIQIRSGTVEDQAACAGICFAAFGEINHRHGFPPDFPDAHVPAELMKMMFANAHVFSVIAEQGGQIVGSSFLWDGSIGGIGPVTVDPRVQKKGVGTLMMRAVLELAGQKQMPGVRLVQAGFNMQSLSLYTKLGFDLREPLACMNGQPPRQPIRDRSVRPMTAADVEACSELCRKVHGHGRRGEVLSALSREGPIVVHHGGAITGYATDIGFFGHAVAMDNTDLIALISAVERISGPGFLLPVRNGEVLRWCLAQGLHVIQPMNLMSRGQYQEPRGPFLPSILF